MAEDLSIAGPGSPVSLDKFIKNGHMNPDSLFTVLVDGTGNGIAHDSPECIYITPDECKDQALHMLYKIFEPNKKIPHYLLRHLDYMFGDHSRSCEYRFKTAQETIDYINNDPENELYKRCFNLFTYGKHNAEFMQVLGLISLTSGYMSMAKAQGTSLKLYYLHPETHLHPKRCSALSSMLLAINEEYK